jgi:phage-related minor tail protein
VQVSAVGSTLNAKVILALDADGMVVGADKSVAQVDRITASVGKLGDTAQRMDGQLRRAPEGLNGFLNSIGRAAVPATAQTNAFLASIGRMPAQLNEAKTGFAGLTTGMQQLMPQINDVVGGMLSGTQSLHMIATQQGPQIFQVWQQYPTVFKELKNGIASLVTPARLAMLGVAGITAALIAGAVASHRYNEELLQDERTLQLYGSRLGMTTDALRAMAGARAAVLGLSQAEGRSLLDTFVTGGGRSALGFEKFAQLANTWALATGKAIGEVQEQLMQAMRDPTRAAGDLQGRLSDVTDEIYQQVRALQEQGDIQGAANLLADAWAKGAEKAAANTSQWARDVRELKNAASDFWDWFRSGGGALNANMQADARFGIMPDKTVPVRKPTGLYEQYKSERNDAQKFVRETIESLDTQGRAFEQIAAREARIRKDLKAERIGEAEAQEALNLLNEKRGKIIDSLLPREERQAKVKRDELDITRQMVGLSQQAYDAAARDAARGVDAWARDTDRARRERQQRHEAARGDIAAGLGGLSAWATPDAQTRRFEALAEEIMTWRDRALSAISDIGEGYDELAAAIEVVFDDQMAQLYEDDLRRRTDWGAGLARANIDIARSYADMASTSENAMRRWASNGEEWFVNLRKSGIKNVGQLADFVIDSFLRMAYQAKLAPAFNAVGGGLLNLAAGLLGGSSGLAMQSVSTSIDTSFIGAQLPTFHTGTGRRTVGEVLGSSGDRIVKVRSDERISTPEQWSDHAGDVMVIGGGGAGAAPVFNFNVVNESGAPIGSARAGVSTPNAQGGYDMEVILAAVDTGLAQRHMQGTSAYTAAMENTGSIGQRRPR